MGLVSTELSSPLIIICDYMWLWACFFFVFFLLLLQEIAYRFGPLWVCRFFLFLFFFLYWLTFIGQNLWLLYLYLVCDDVSLSVSAIDSCCSVCFEDHCEWGVRGKCVLSPFLLKWFCYSCSSCLCFKIVT